MRFLEYMSRNFFYYRCKECYLYYVSIMVFGIYIGFGLSSMEVLEFVMGRGYFLIELGN